jgi:hypothetical protein
LQEERRSVERFILEFDQHKEYIERKIGEADLESLTYTNLSGKQKLRNENLSEAVQKEIKYLMNTYKEHMNFLITTFSDYVQMLNVDAIYGLQIVTIWLSLIAIAIAFLGILGNWESIVGLVKLVVSY